MSAGGASGATTQADEPSAAAICAALGVAATPEQATQLEDFLALLQRWNATYNLTAVRDPAAMRVQHLADCVAVLPPLLRLAGVRRVLDVGSGGGLPGVVIAILAPQLDVTCIDAVGKKAAFIRQVAGALALPNLHAVHTRVEALSAAPFDVITSRAFSSLSDLARLTQRHLAAGGVWMAMKAQVPSAEMADLKHAVDVFHVEQLDVPGLNAQRRLVWMRPRHA